MSDPYKEGYEKGKLDVKTNSIGRINPYLSARPLKGEYEKFIAWNRGYDDAVAESKSLPKPKKKTTVKKK